MYRGVIWRADGKAVELLTQTTREDTRVLVVERDAATGARRVVAAMDSVGAAEEEADLRVLRAGGFLGARLSQLLNQPADAAVTCASTGSLY